MKVQEMVLNSTPLFVCLKLNVIILKLADKFPQYYLCQETLLVFLSMKNDEMYMKR